MTSKPLTPFFAFLSLLNSLSLLNFLELSSALPTAKPAISVARRNGTSCLSAPPTSFGITSFTRFTPSAGNSNPASIYFEYQDVTTNIFVVCSAEKNATAAASAPFMTTCEGGEVQFTYCPEENKLTVVEEWARCDLPALEFASGSLSVETYCYPTESPMPEGAGTQCQIPGNWEYGVLTMV